MSLKEVFNRNERLIASYKEFLLHCDTLHQRIALSVEIEILSNQNRYIERLSKYDQYKQIESTIIYIESSRNENNDQPHPIAV